MTTMSDCAASARAAYDEFAPYYDEFTAHHDYDSWTAELEAAARDCGLTGTRLLDVGCGTGKSFLPFLRRGWTVTGCDLSAGMVELARAKAPGVRVEVCDMRTLPTLGAFDLVCCVDDGVNYLTEPDDVVRALRAMRRNLGAGGLALFDVNTLATYRGFFASSSVVRGEDRVLVWHGETPADAGAGVLARATLMAFSRRGPEWTRADSVHRQRHHPPAGRHAALAAAGLEPVAVYGQGLDVRPVRGLDERSHTKAIFVARAVAPSGD
jgi:SAM-dependent methyltransferase